MNADATPSHASLPRAVGVFGAVMMGLGSIIGTGVFVSIGIAANVAGPAVILAIALAALIAAANGLSSAQLAANHPVSGGTYEYGYRYLNAPLGFTAGWMFLCAKSASAATAALGLGGYILTALGIGGPAYRQPIGVGVVVVLAFVVAAGIRRSNRVNIIIVSVTLATLALFVAVCLPTAIENGASFLTPFFPEKDGAAGGFGHAIAAVLQATALMFVAYTGYGRIATLGEEIHDPRRNIPRAVIISLAVTMVLYVSVAAAGIAAASVDVMGTAGTRRAAPLEVTAHYIAGKWAGVAMAVGAVTAMLGVLLNLILGLSRVALAMGRRGDLPARFAGLDETGQTPTAAVVLVAVIIGGLVLIGDVKTTWSFSAFTVLIYYAITNMAALRLPREQRLYPPWIAVLGLGGCAFLAFWVEPVIWMIGLGVIAAGLIWHFVRRRRSRSTG